MTELTKEAMMRCLFALAFVLVAASLGTGTVTGCGGEERLSREEFSDRLQTIDERGGELWARLAEHAEDIGPGEPLPADVKPALTALIEFQEQATAELEALNPPEGAEEPVAMLIEALRKRTETFEQVIEAGRFTERGFQRVTQSGEEIDQASQQLRAKGLGATADVHGDE